MVGSEYDFMVVSIKSVMPELKHIIKIKLPRPIATPVAIKIFLIFDAHML